MTASDPARVVRARREPPRFRQASVARVERLSPYLVRVTLGGADLAELVVEHPAASVRLLLPAEDTGKLVIPAWNGNEFLLPGGRRPLIRTFTPRRVDTDTAEVDVDVVVHDGGPASRWAERAARTGPGGQAALSGPGRGYAIDAQAPGFVLAGDETAIPAIGQLLETLPAAAAVQVHVEVAHPDARLPLPEHRGATISWHDLPPGGRSGATLVEAVVAAKIDTGTRVWAAGEAAAMQRIRRHLFEDRGLGRAQATVRGYWSNGRIGGADESE